VSPVEVASLSDSGALSAKTSDNVEKAPDELDELLEDDELEEELVDEDEDEDEDEEDDDEEVDELLEVDVEDELPDAPEEDEDEELDVEVEVVLLPVRRAEGSRTITSSQPFSLLPSRNMLNSASFKAGRYTFTLDLPDTTSNSRRRIPRPVLFGCSFSRFFIRKSKITS
jgi:hypothetical protein